MGVYDNYGDVQIKAGNPCYLDFKDGDKADPTLADGIYLGHEGAVVIHGGIFIGCLPLYDKWGGEIDTDALLRDGNPIEMAIRALPRPDHDPLPSDDDVKAS